VSDEALALFLDAAALDAHAPLLAALHAQHRQLAAQLATQISPAFEKYIAELGQQLREIALAGEITNRSRAHVLAYGELLASELGAEVLRAQGIECAWWDAREGLQSELRAHASEPEPLSATCDFSADAALRARLAALPPVVVTQGFIARNPVTKRYCWPRRLGHFQRISPPSSAPRVRSGLTCPAYSAPTRTRYRPHAWCALHYDEAQDRQQCARVLHPRCTAAQAGANPAADLRNAPRSWKVHVSGGGRDGAAQAGAAPRKGITWVPRYPGMWHQVDFSPTCSRSSRHRVSVDLVATSETNVTVSSIRALTC
jgi:diaminopimelate decarboxylase/aspartate kinase